MICLIDCWVVHKSKEFLGWMKEQTPKHTSDFCTKNFTSELQLIDAILQWPLNHAFKVQFNNWTIELIKQQIEVGRDLEIDVKMSNLKPRICQWLHSTWEEIKTIQIMIVKGREQTSITRAYSKWISIG
jgi:hypothetical protein